MTDGRAVARRALVTGVLPLVVYAVLRPQIGADAPALAAAGAVPLVLLLGFALRERRVEPILLISSIGFAIACAVSLIVESSLPLKLHDAVVTFTIGIALLVGVAIGRPIPLGHLARGARPGLDRTIGVIAGALLVLHALVHVALALTLGTSSWLVYSRVVTFAIVAAGWLALRRYVRAFPR